MPNNNNKKEKREYSRQMPVCAQSCINVFRKIEQGFELQTNRILP